MARGIVSSISGQATRATFSPDNKNAYVVGPNALWVWNVATGWSTYTSGTTPPGPTQPSNTCNLDNNTPGSGTYDPFCGPGLALTVLAPGPNLSAKDFQQYCLTNVVDEPSDLTPMSLAEAERQAIERALGATGGNKTQAAQLLGITPKTLNAKLTLYSKE